MTEPNPFAPPGPPTQPVAPQPGYQPYPAYPAYPAPQPPPGRPSNTLAIVSLVVSGIALLAALGVAVLFLGGPAGAGSSDVLTGKVVVEESGGTSAEELTEEIQGVLEDDLWDVSDLTCPATPEVAQGVTTVCHADMDGSDWAIVVLFEDTDGTYTLDLI